MTRWTRALNALDSGDVCQAASARDALRQLRADYPRFGAIQSFVKQAEDSAAGARCGPSAGVVASVTGLIVLLVGVAAGVLYFLHRRGSLTLPLPLTAARPGAPLGPGSRPVAAPEGAPVGATVGATVGAGPYLAAQPWPGVSLVYPSPYQPAPYAAPYAAPYGTSYAAPFAAPYAAPYGAPYLTPSPSGTPSYPGAQGWDGSTPRAATGSTPRAATGSTPRAATGSTATGSTATGSTATGSTATGSTATGSTPTTARGMTQTTPGSVDFSTIPPASAPTSPAMAARAADPQSTLPDVRRCVNGHSVTDASARRCRECGGLVYF